MTKPKPRKSAKASASTPDRLVRNLNIKVSKDAERKVRGGMVSSKFLSDKV